MTPAALARHLRVPMAAVRAAIAAVHDGEWHHTGAFAAEVHYVQPCRVARILGLEAQPACICGHCEGVPPAALADTLAAARAAEKTRRAKAAAEKNHKAAPVIVWAEISWVTLSRNYRGRVTEEHHSHSGEAVVSGKWLVFDSFRKDILAKSLKKVSVTFADGRVCDRPDEIVDVAKSLSCEITDEESRALRFLDSLGAGIRDDIEHLRKLDIVVGAAREAREARENARFESNFPAVPGAIGSGIRRVAHEFASDFPRGAETNRAIHWARTRLRGYLPDFSIFAAANILQSSMGHATDDAAGQLMALRGLPEPIL